MNKTPQEIYDLLCIEADNILSVNPCKIENIKGSATCIGEFGVPCCHQACPSLGGTGCITQNIACKMYLCPEAIKNLKSIDISIFEKWVELSGIVGKLKLKGVRYSTRENAITKIDMSKVNKLVQLRDMLNNIL